MKKINVLISILLTVFCFSAHAQITTTTTGNIPARTVVAPIAVAPIITKVISVAIVLDSTTHAPGGTSYHLHYKGVFNTIGTSPVSYQWVTTNITHPAPAPKIVTGTFIPNGKGTDEVFYETGYGPGNAYKMTLQVTSPNQISSTPTTY